MHRALVLAALIALVVVMPEHVYGQVSHGGAPIDATLTATQILDTRVMGRVDVDTLLREDAQQTKDTPMRFAHQFLVELSIDSAGSWMSLPDGTRVWRLRIDSPGAISLNFVLSEYELFPGNQLFVYNLNRTTVLGAFTWENNKPNREFAIQPVPSDVAIFELVVAPGSKPGRLAISHVNHAYRAIGVLGYGDSGACNVNTICPEGDAWRDQIRSVALILTSSGSRICTGALINNARQDGRQLFLTAYHCLSSGSANWIFMFNYESPTCPRTQQRDGPTTATVQGTVTLASGRNNDFVLFELRERIPASYNVYYSGFSAQSTAASSVVGIHHPSGDIKKYCASNSPVVSSSWPGSTANSHWQVRKWDVATTEPGSSGSPLYDQNKRIVGQLHGGEATCSYQFNDYYGKLSESWNQGLKAFLDPDNTGTLVVDGRNA
eukprot:TRINITY_DN14312_c0_g1_i1.p1 TRINITY_DN14312_c0_g1~~TRINITY_DN14312_c0_g1_i1.p1  ORF type:complete len:436 (-),score=94.03 TRINITY_DN14312_c0_g1_i1:292-1599(-)